MWFDAEPQISTQRRGGRQEGLPRTRREGRRGTRCFEDQRGSRDRRLPVTDVKPPRSDPDETLDQSSRTRQREWRRCSACRCHARYRTSGPARASSSTAVPRLLTAMSKTGVRASARASSAYSAIQLLMTPYVAAPSPATSSRNACCVVSLLHRRLVGAMVLPCRGACRRPRARARLRGHSYPQGVDHCQGAM